METDKKLEYIEQFKKQFEKEIKDIKYDDFEKYFYAENYFLSSKNSYLPKKFNLYIFDIIGNILKGLINELEYYINIKPTTPLASSDVEILSKKNKEILKYYLTLHSYYKEYHKIHILGESNTDDSKQFLQKIFEQTTKFMQYSAKLQIEFAENLNKKTKEISKDEDNTKFNSSIYH